MSERVFIVGAGQVGRGLFRAFRGSGIEVLGLHGRRHTAWTTSTGSIPSSVSDANTIMLAVRDNQIDTRLRSSSIRGLTIPGRDWQPALYPSHVRFCRARSCFPSCRNEASEEERFDPLIPFGNPERVPELLRKASIGIEWRRSRTLHIQAYRRSHWLGAHLKFRLAASRYITRRL